MGIFSLSEVFGLGPPKEDMAKASKRTRASTNDELVVRYADRLKRAGEVRASFEPILAEIKTDKSLSSADVISIAQIYNLGGKKASSKATALAAISKRFVEVVRFHAKNRIAEKARPW